MVLLHLLQNHADTTVASAYTDILVYWYNCYIFINPDIVSAVESLKPKQLRQTAISSDTGGTQRNWTVRWAATSLYVQLLFK